MSPDLALVPDCGPLCFEVKPSKNKLQNNLAPFLSSLGEDWRTGRLTCTLIHLHIETRCLMLQAFKIKMNVRLVVSDVVHWAAESSLHPNPAISTWQQH